MHNVQGNIVRFTTAALLTALLSGCASDIKSVTMSPDHGKLVTVHALNLPSTEIKKLKTTLGDDMFTNEKYIIALGSLEFNTATMQTPANAQIKHKLKTIGFHLAPAHLRSEGYSSEGQHYAYPRAFATTKNAPAYGGLIAPIESPELATKIYWAWNPSDNNHYYTAVLLTPIKLKIEKIAKNADSEAHKPLTQALIYSGVSDGKIRFIYKEFTRGGYARPDFTQDLTLHYTPGEEYAFKNARFIVHKASNTFIEFSLIKGF
jgi:hypothetical protein